MHAVIVTAHGSASDDAELQAQLTPVLARADLEFVLLLGAQHRLERLAATVPASAAPLFGCTTSGEITRDGYADGSVVCVGFLRSHFTAVARRIDGLRAFGFQDARDLLQSATWELRERAPNSAPRTTFALLLIDSTSQAEEFVAAALGSELGNIPLLGGSAGDNWQLQRAPVLDAGVLHDDAALLLLVHTDLEFRHYNFHHYQPSSVRAVITAATPAKRLVHQINGAPAIEEYARLCGLQPGDIDLEHLSSRPLIIMIGDKAYARGFAQVLDDGSMRFACAIDEGMVFRVARHGDFVAELDARFEEMRAAIGVPHLVLGFECAARRMEIDRTGISTAVAALYRRNNVWGFCCMGEQSNAIHMNNSFNCLAFAAPS